MYVIFEGVDTSGKSTQVELCKKTYPSAIITKEPGGTPFGVSIRQMILDGVKLSPITEAFLFLADRSEHYAQLIKPNRDKLIISDRGVVSGIAYALANGDIGFEVLEMLNKVALEGTKPDKVVLFCTDKELILQRLQIKHKDNIEQRGIEYLLRVQNHMIEVLQRLQINHLLIDSHMSIEQINNQIRSYIDDPIA
jgi:dTMP kinase